MEKITAKIAKPGTYFEGYDLHFREGKNSYFANGFLCLLNYPEMTLKRIMDNMSVMTETDRNAFVSLIQDKQELFIQVFGEAVMHQFEQEVAHAKFENS